MKPLSLIEQEIAEKKVVMPLQWLDLALDLNRIIYDEQDKLFDLEQQVALRVEEEAIKLEKRNMAAAENKVKGTDLYKDMRRQRAKCERIEELIRLAKHQAKLREFGQ